jgi:hypothetical protein
MIFLTLLFNGTKASSQTVFELGNDAVKHHQALTIPETKYWKIMAIGEGG